MILEIILINDIYIVAFFLCPYYLKWCEGEVGALNQEGGGYFFASGVTMGTYYTRVAFITRNTVLLNRQGTHMRAINYKWVQM